LRTQFVIAEHRYELPLARVVGQHDREGKRAPCATAAHVEGDRHWGEDQGRNRTLRSERAFF
jgi:hypothetical protein